MNPGLNLNSPRARKARVSASIGKGGYQLAGLVALIFLAAAAWLFLSHISRGGYVALAIALMGVMVATWYRFDLSKIPPRLPSQTLDDVLDQDVLAALKMPLTPRKTWDAIAKQWQVNFICNHLLLHKPAIADALSTREQDMPVIWEQVEALVHGTRATQIHAGTLAAALILTSPGAEVYLTHNKLRKEDVFQLFDWLERQLE